MKQPAASSTVETACPRSWRQRRTTSLRGRLPLEFCNVGPCAKIQLSPL